jgi:hypothetical protein
MACFCPLAVWSVAVFLCWSVMSNATPDLLPVLPRKSNCGPRTNRERNTKMVAMFRDGATHREIAEAFGLCLAAASRVIRMYGVSRLEGGKSVKAKVRREAEAISKRERFVREHGILPEDFPSAQVFKQAKKKYFQQRKSAGSRGVSWEISLGDWWCIWDASGHWADRGRGIGKYCMARHGDIGPYKAGNVSIQLATENSRDGIKKAHASMKRSGNWSGGVPIGSGRGWTYIKRAVRRPYQVMLGKKYVGAFATQQEAEAAYQREASVRFHECVHVARASHATPLNKLARRG